MLDAATCSGRRYSASQAGRQILVAADASMSTVSVDNLMRAPPERQMFPVAGAQLHLWAKGGIRGDRLGLRSRLRPPRRLSLDPRTDRQHHRARSPRACQDGPGLRGLSPATRRATRPVALSRVLLRDGPALSR